MVKKFTNIQEKEICKQYFDKKISAYTLSKRWDCNPSTIENTLKRQGYHLRSLSESHKGKSSPKKGKKLSEETKQKISKSHKGKKLSKEHKEKIGKASKERRHSEETKQKISISHKGKKFFEEHKKNLSKTHKGKKLSVETKQKIGEAKKGEKNPFYGRHHSEKSKRKIREAKKGKCHSKETRKKMSESALLRMQNHSGPYKDTKPELKMKDIFNDLNISFKHQFRLGNHLFDFHILNTNILIEVDGDYWHGNPKVFKKLDKIQKESKQRDKKVNKLAKENNFVLLRFWQNDILNNTEIVRNKILENNF